MKILKWFEYKWKVLNRDFKIEVKSIKLVSPYILIIDFIADNDPYYVVIHGDYKELRSKHLKRNNVEPITFEEYMEEINLLIPSEDVIKHYYKQWMLKK